QTVRSDFQQALQVFGNQERRISHRGLQRSQSRKLCEPGVDVKRGIAELDLQYDRQRFRPGFGPSAGTGLYSECSGVYLWLAATNSRACGRSRNEPTNSICPAIQFLNRPSQGNEMATTELSLTEKRDPQV